MADGDVLLSAAVRALLFRWILAAPRGYTAPRSMVDCSSAVGTVGVAVLTVTYMVATLQVSASRWAREARVVAVMAIVLKLVRLLLSVPSSVATVAVVRKVDRVRHPSCNGWRAKSDLIPSRLWNPVLWNFNLWNPVTCGTTGIMCGVVIAQQLVPIGDIVIRSAKVPVHCSLANAPCGYKRHSS